jgi:hypothetical protein
MTTPETLHPLARQFLEKSTEFGYALAIPLCREIAQRSPFRCVTWTLALVESEITKITDHAAVADALAVVRESLANPSENLLPRLDAAAWQAWACDFNYDSAPFYAHRAASGLAWATMGAIIGLCRCQFESQFIGIKSNAENADDYAVGYVARECERALGIVFSKSPEGWLRVAKSFTLEMEKPE